MQAGFTPAVPPTSTSYNTPCVASERWGFRGGAISKAHPHRARRATAVLTRALFHREAGDRLEHPVDLLNLVDDERTDRVDVGGLAYGDDVVLARDGVGGRDALHAFHLLGHSHR